ncbi:MAG: iron-containing redox enzyme family protein [Nitrospiraceae bacterium]
MKVDKIRPPEDHALEDIQGAKPAPLKIPVRLKVLKTEFLGHTETMSLHGLQMVCDSLLRSGAPMTLQFSFGDMCYLNVSGQVVACHRQPDGEAGRYRVSISLAAIRGFERNILRSAIHELQRDPRTQEHSLLTINISKDSLAEEASTLIAHSARAVSSSDTHGRGGRKRKWTPDPPWIQDLQRQVEPHWAAILQCRLVQEASAGTLSLTQMRAWLTQLYPFIEAFPKWLALNITKTEDPLSLGFLIDNVRVEKRHADQWMHMAKGFGIDARELHDIRVIPPVEALSHWLWSINTQGTLAEAVAATSFAIEGVTQGIAKSVIKGLPLYDGSGGVQLDRKALWWMEAHAKYDDLHPVQALEIMKLYATTTALEEKATFAAQRSLEYLLMALDACYTQFPSKGMEGRDPKGVRLSKAGSPSTV